MDRFGNIVSDSFKLQIMAPSLLVDAGPDREITLPENNINLIGLCSSPEEGCKRLTWQSNNNTNLHSESFSGGIKKITLLLENLEEGTYEYTLIGESFEGQTHSDKVQVKVVKAQ